MQLGKHFKKTEDQLAHPRLTDTVLTPEAILILSELNLEREAAREEQGNPERVQEWWAVPTMVGKKKEKKTKGKRKAKTQGAAAAQSASAEGPPGEVGALGLGEEEDGGVMLGEEEESKGFDSPVMMSPGSPMEDDREEEGCEGFESPVMMSP